MCKHEARRRLLAPMMAGVLVALSISALLNRSQRNMPPRNLFRARVKLREDNPTDGDGCVFILASFPFTGNTMLRNLLDLATGVPAQSVYGTEGGEKNNRTNAFVHSCGTNSGKELKRQWKAGLRDKSRVDILRRAMSSVAEGVDADFTPCSLFKVPSREDLSVIKTHYPVLNRGEFSHDKFIGGNASAICGVILTDRRSDTLSWCKKHGKAMEKRWMRDDNHSMAACQENMRKTFTSFNENWVKISSSGALKRSPVFTVNFEKLTSSDSANPRAELKRLLNFMNVRTSKERIELSLAVHLRQYVLPKSDSFYP